MNHQQQDEHIILKAIQLHLNEKNYITEIQLDKILCISPTKDQPTHVLYWHDNQLILDTVKGKNPKTLDPQEPQFFHTLEQCLTNYSPK